MTQQFLGRFGGFGHLVGLIYIAVDSIYEKNDSGEARRKKKFGELLISPEIQRANCMQLDS